MVIHALNAPTDLHRHLPVTQLFWDSTIVTIHHPQHTVHLTASNWTAGRWRSDWQVHDVHLLARFALATLQIILRLPPRSRPFAYLSRKHPRFCLACPRITPRDAFAHTSCFCRHPFVGLKWYRCGHPVAPRRRLSGLARSISNYNAGNVTRAGTGHDRHRRARNISPPGMT